ncbi:MAG: UPF0182 family protein [Candidatus Poribacteria bacterium]|nr:UPF0182 family protein [Candidatus Poribacteria bacterium]
MQPRFARFIILGAVLAVVLGGVAILVKIYPDLLWFDMVGYVAIYKTILLTKIALGVVIGGAFLAVTLTNLYLISRFTPSRLSPRLMESIPLEGIADFDLRKGLYVVLTLLAIGGSALAGYMATDYWEVFLRYSKASGLTFQSATSLTAPANRGATEVLISQWELDAKGFQAGDDVTIEEGDRRQTAQIQSVEIVEDGHAKLQLNRALDFDTTQKAVVTSSARDPIFHKDINYYVFRMPLERYICGTLFGLFMLLTLFTAVIYFFHGSLITDGNRFEPPPRVKTHLFTLICLLLLFRAWNYRFAMYDLLYTTSDVVRGGGGYAAMHARLPVLKIMMGLAILCALVFLISIFLRRITFAVGSVVVLLLVGFIGQVYPRLIQNLKVEPSKQKLEAKYINYNIRATLHAYDLEDNTVTEKEYPLTRELSYEDITHQENAAVINSIRLWDWRPLRRTFRQLQELRSQYDFPDVDIDRYTMANEEPRQVMLATRELNIEDLSREVRNDWYKRTYVYTHGYGAVLSPVNEIIGGKPKMYIRDMDPINYEPEWTYRFNENPGPRTYYGERTNHYIIVHPDRSEPLEFDYPQAFGQDFAKYSYTGKGGVELSSFWRKLIYTLKFSNEIKFVLPGEIESTSRVLYHRNIKERVRKIAPFLRYDDDPYLVIHDGRLVWMIDAYTTTTRYPYSAPMQDVIRARVAERAGRRAVGRIAGGERPWGNYIRNAVKVRLDAYDGTVTFYLMEQEKDPIAECYRRIFPDLFKPFDEMPQELKKHIRYPTTMFLLQARMYQDYHMKDPITFYASEDQWEIGEELYDSTERPRPQQPLQPTSPFASRSQSLPEKITNVQEVAPYYIVIKIPGEERAEFVLMLPFTPKNKSNLTAWISARCDLPQYGQLLVYRFPKGQLVPGPMQLENFISQEPEISQQISLWNTQGSRVLRGNLLIIPMNDAILYVEPIYIQAENEESAIPELRRVVVGYKENVTWGESLDEALIKMFGRKAPAVVPTSYRPDSEEMEGEVEETPPLDQTPIPDLVKQARQHYEGAQAAQRDGNWAEYGRYLDLLEKALKQLEANVQ